MNTAEFLDALLAKVPPLRTVLVSSLGRTADEIYRRWPDDALFIDSMGDVCGLSMGIAIGAPALSVIGVDTDGSFLMNLSVMPTLGALASSLANYCLVIMDNGCYESGSGLPSRSVDLDWERMFAAFGIPARVIVSAEALPDQLIGGGVLIARVRNELSVPESVKLVDGRESSYRMEARLSALRGVARRRPAVKS